MTHQKKQIISDDEQKLQDLIEMVLRMAEVKGWSAKVAAMDEEKYRYATVAVARVTPGSSVHVSGLFEITCDKRIKITYQCTSFNNFGLADLYDAIGNEICQLPWVKPRETEKPQPVSQNFASIERLLRRFHNIARQMKHRHEDRQALVIKDEYDVQDLLHALLRGIYDDVRTEEHCPSYAGRSSRMDFLLKQEQVVIETKMASEKLKDKQIGEQLIVDIKRYQKHPDCKRLICLVYDPYGCLKNPGALEADLSGIHEKMEVKVIVVSV